MGAVIPWRLSSQICPPRSSLGCVAAPPAAPHQERRRGWHPGSEMPCPTPRPHNGSAKLPAPPVDCSPTQRAPLLRSQVCCLLPGVLPGSCSILTGDGVILARLEADRGGGLREARGPFAEGLPLGVRLAHLLHPRALCAQVFVLSQARGWPPPFLGQGGDPKLPGPQVNSQLAELRFGFGTWAQALSKGRQEAALGAGPASRSTPRHGGGVSVAA